MPTKKSRQVRRAEERARGARLASSRGRSSRRPLVLALGSVAVLLLVVGGLIGVKLAGGGSPEAAGGGGAGRASASVVNSVKSIPPSAFDRVGYQPSVVPPQRISGKPLVLNGKPQVVYVGAEYCPYCAAERWAIVTALSRFGTFSKLGATHSSTSDVYPDTPTFSFHGATYTSRYVGLQAVETYTNIADGNSYKPLDTPTALEASLASRYDSGGSIPFVDIGNRYMIAGATYDPALLQGLTMSQVAAALHDPSSPLCRAVLGTANAVTAALCQATGGKPSTVCTSPGVTASAAKLGT